MNEPIHSIPPQSIVGGAIATLTVLILATGPKSTAADPPAGLYKSLTGEAIADHLDLTEFGMAVGGWAAVGFTHNAEHPRDRLNSPVSFNDRADELHVHQLCLFVERSVDVKSKRFDLGGRFDFMFGTDTPYTQATGHWDDSLISEKNPRFYDIALPQAYFEIATPWGNGLSAKLGHFYSILGYESVASPSNFFYSHSYSMKSSPFTHTGFLLAYPVREDFVLYSGAVAGADNFDRNFGAWSYLGGFTWMAENGESGFQFSVLNGDVSERINDSRTYFSAVWRHRFGQKLHYAFQHDHGWQDHALDSGDRNARWYSIVQYLTYDLTDDLKMGLRGEWFRDQDGFRYNAGEAGYYALALGLNWRPTEWLMLRPELRHDWADSSLPAYARGRRSSQLLVGADAVIQF